jgi:hypothetical protein
LSGPGSGVIVRVVRYIEIGCRLLLATVFVGALVGKVTSRAAFRAFVLSLRQMAVLPASFVAPAARLSIGVEALVAVLLFVPTRVSAAAGFLLGAGLLAVFTVAITLSLRRGNRAPCRCFGASAAPLGPRHVVRNLTLIVVAVLGVAATLREGQLDVAPSLVAGAVGMFAGLLVTMFDDLLDLMRPPARS